MNTNASPSTRARRLIARVAIAAALALPLLPSALPYAGHADAQARWIVKLGTTASAEAPLAGILSQLAQQLEAAHPGRFWVKRIVDGALARERPPIARVASGETHGYAATYDELVAAVPDAIALSAPFAFDNERDADAVLSGNGGNALRDALAGQGLRLIAIAPCETRVLLSSDHPILSPVDVQGRTVARHSDPAHVLFASALGMKPIEEVEHAEVRDATLSQLAASGAFFKGRHLTLTDHALECGALVLSQRWIDGLPNQMQATVGKLSRELSEDATKTQRAAREAILARAKALRVQVTTLDAQQRRAFVEATRDARVKLNGEPGSLARKLALAAQAR